MRILLTTVLAALLSVAMFAQQPFAIHITPSTLNNVPAIHSGAVAVHQGKWIFIGGRKDGIHNMQANQAFPAYNRNDSVFIYDPVADTKTGTSIMSLTPALSGALASSNMQFYQDNAHLYMCGGYGWVDSLFTWKTFPLLISVNLDSLINAVSTGDPIDNSFRFISDTTMAVAGGALEKTGTDYRLVFGHRFDGFYTRQNSGAFTQHYTEEIRTFSITDDANGLSISNYSAVSDTANFHRRDYNLVPQIFPDRSYGLTAFGGVFRKDIDLPYLTPVDIHPGSYQHQASFNQNLVQYTTAVLPLYDSINNYMHSVFLGGMSLFTLDTVNNVLIRDTLVPFTKSISKISRDGAGNLVESQLHDQLPKYLSNTYFIPVSTMPVYSDKIFDLNAVNGNQLAGYLIGGIEADDKNVADLDPNGMSRPGATVYEVYVDKNVTRIDENIIPAGLNNVSLFPNPSRDNITVSFSLPEVSNCEIDVLNSEGRVMRKLYSGKNISGEQRFNFALTNFKSGVYTCRISTGIATKAIRFIVQ